MPYAIASTMLSRHVANYVIGIGMLIAIERCYQRREASIAYGRNLYETLYRTGNVSCACMRKRFGRLRHIAGIFERQPLVFG